MEPGPQFQVTDSAAMVFAHQKLKPGPSGSSEGKVSQTRDLFGLAKIFKVSSKLDN